MVQLPSHCAATQQGHGHVLGFFAARNQGPATCLVAVESSCGDPTSVAILGQLWWWFLVLGLPGGLPNSHHPGGGKGNNSLRDQLSSIPLAVISGGPARNPLL